MQKLICMNIKYSIFTELPEGFDSTLKVAGCYCEWEDKILLLKRHPEKHQGNTWGVPAGKMEENESPRMTVIREVWEEIGLNIDDEGLQSIGQLYCSLPNIDYIFYMFRKRFAFLPKIDLELEEHIEENWVTIEEAYKLPLIAGGIEALNYYKQKRL